MKVEHPDHPCLTPAELESLDHLRALINRAVSDGVVTKAEMDGIKAALRTEHWVSSQELDLVQELIWSKVQSGDLSLDWQ